MLDATDGSMRITASSSQAFVPAGHSVAPSRTGELCATPCVADLPVGQYQLFLVSADGSYSRGDKDTLNVQPGTNYYLRAPGRYKEAEWIHVGPTLLLLGAAALFVVGTGVLGAADDDSGALTGGLLIGGGVAFAIGGGVWLYDSSRGEVQQGATTSWVE